MKKVIAILVIAIVLVGAVFAADNAAITVSVDVAEHVPTFKLITQGNTNILNAEGSDAVEDNGKATAGSVEFTETISKGLADATDATITFAVVQVKPSTTASEGKIKTNKQYSFTVTASDLVLSTAGTTPEDNEMFERGTISTFAETEGAIGSDFATITDGTSTLSILYTGKTYAPAAEVSFATFTVTWGANPTALPGTYTANVILTMTTP